MTEQRQPPNWEVLGPGEQHCSNPVPGLRGGATLPDLFLHTPRGFIVLATDKTVVGRVPEGESVTAVEVSEEGNLLVAGQVGGVLTPGQLAALPAPPAPPPAEEAAPEPKENVATGGMLLPAVGASSRTPQ